jgi:hypothetical protein
MHARGYSLGTHTNILLSDLNENPKPRDIGYRFPRQFPIWSAHFFEKDTGKHTRTSRVTVQADGQLSNDFKIEVGEFIKTIGVPVWLECSQGELTVEAVELKGYPTLLKDGAALHIDIGKHHLHSGVNQAAEVTLKDTKPVTVTIAGPYVTLPAAAGGESVPFLAKLIITPSKPGTKVKLTVRNDTPDYTHVNE